MEQKEGILLSSNGINRMNIGGEIGWFSREQNDSTGYSWKCLPDNSGVYEIIEEIHLRPSTKEIGVPGMNIWKFKAVRKGKGAVVFELMPPRGEEPVKRFVIEIKGD